MSAPRFSILIPTRDRPATFRYTLSTAVSQSGDDYEVVVADNCGSPATRMIVDEAATHASRIVYLRSDEILPMAENWERGLRACSGEYVTILGDDDGLLPTTLHVARRMIQSTQAQLLTWAPHVYFWPDIVTYWQANQLMVDFGNGTALGNSRAMLKDFYAGRVEFNHLPTIYGSFVHRSILERAYDRFGAYFTPAMVAPDISSGILNLCLCERFIYSMRPLSVRGGSGKSTGTAQGWRSFGKAQLEQYQQDERSRWKELIHPSLIPSPNLRIVVASAKLKCRDAYFPDDPELQVDLESLVREILAALNIEPEAYNENLAEALELAAKIGMTVRAEDIPAQDPPGVRRRNVGPMRIGENFHRVLIDCNLAGVFNIADAARLAESTMTPYEG